MRIKNMPEYLKIVDQVNQWNTEYYIEDKPSVSDAVYDAAMRDLQEFENKYPTANAFTNSPTKKIGSPVTVSKLTKIKRERKMMSLANAFTSEDVQKFFEDTKAGAYCIEWKYDGLGIELVYDKGILIQATTRGDGLVGEDVLHTVRLMKNVPLNISVNDHCIVRGEAVVSRKVFKQANKDGIQYSSPRNMAAGIVRSLDNSKMKQFPVVFRPYELFVNNRKLPRQSDSLLYLTSLGFAENTYNFVVIPADMQKCQDVYDQFLDDREDYFFDVDGIVIKVDDSQKAFELGCTSKFPKSAIAWKFPTMAVQTRIKKVINQVGRTGAVTPVFIFDPPAIIDGAEVTRATGHNYSEVKRLGLGVGAEVLVTRNGGVVPGISEVLVKAKKVHEAPRMCPSCNSLLKQHQVLLTCENPGCNAVTTAELEHFASRDCMDITGMGTKTAELFTNKLGMFILRFSDPVFWRLNYSDIEKVVGIARTKQIYTGLQERWRNGHEYHKIIYALGLPEIGEQKSKILAEKFSPEALLIVSPEQLMELDGFGEVIAEEVSAYIWENKNDIARIFEFFKPVRDTLKKVSTKLEGKHLCITGTLSQPRKVFESHIIKNGGTVQGTITRKTDWLIIGDSPGNDKVTKAQKLEVKVIKESDFMEMLR